MFVSFLLRLENAMRVQIVGFLILNQGNVNDFCIVDVRVMKTILKLLNTV